MFYTPQRYNRFGVQTDTEYKQFVAEYPRPHKYWVCGDLEGYSATIIPFWSPIRSTVNPLRSSNRSGDSDGFCYLGSAEWIINTVISRSNPIKNI